MKDKFIMFFLSMGIPVSSINTINKCNGFCGNCQLNCLPSILIIFILGYKFILSKIKKKWHAKHEGNWL
ncbi:hypothetical protein [Megamonas funiformis]|uniref:hypothetical protein n=1 Tax=Megamonas funiformis TaxID=437897 RepID=UPI002676D772|nr:hypothetical protein [Megamonas funiformis]